ncbi:GspH/FimT family pseudopilin [Endozoicomonas sp. OPT23]|uniref:GspH/FimT family pseudopilin n=1 Tax=Endozoicomonas sp. OPT23 TaxID=2072845 RepID=UPI0018912E07
MCKQRAPEKRTFRQSTGRGFSLIEVMIVLVLMSILASMSTTLGSLLDRFKLDSGSQAAVGSINLTRSEAIKRGSLVSICRSSTGLDCDSTSTDWSTGWTVFTNPNDNDSIDAGEEVIRYHNGISSTLRMTWTSGNTLTFNPRGRPVSSGSFVVCLNGRTGTDLRTVAVSGTGTVRKSSLTGNCN